MVEEEGYELANVFVWQQKTAKNYSRCTFHMCPFKNYFTKYHDFDGGRVIIGNNSMCKIIRIGNVSLKLHNSSIRVVKLVKHVVNLKRNLISLGILDQI